MGPRGFALAIRLPTSRAYWNLRAEQVMGKVFQQEAFDHASERHLVPVDVDVHEPPPQPPTPAKPTPQQQPKPATPWAIVVLSSLAVAGAVSSGWLINNLQQSRSLLDQERSVMLIERLRTQNAANQPLPSTQPTPPQPTTPQPSATNAAPTAPPPPEPQWMQSLEPLQLPIRQLPHPEAAIAMAPAPVTTPIPDLTGVVQGPAGSSSAIFQIGPNSMSAGVGDAIGSSGWTLESVSETGAVISQNGQKRNLTVGGVF